MQITFGMPVIFIRPALVAGYLLWTFRCTNALLVHYSACHTGGGVSAVLQRIHVPDEYIAGTLRLSVGRHTTVADVDKAAQSIIKAVKAVPSL